MPKCIILLNLRLLCTIVVSFSSKSRINKLMPLSQVLDHLEALKRKTAPAKSILQCFFQIGVGLSGANYFFLFQILLDWWYLRYYVACYVWLVPAQGGGFFIQRIKVAVEMLVRYKNQSMTHDNTCMSIKYHICMYMTIGICYKIHIYFYSYLWQILNFWLDRLSSTMYSKCEILNFPKSQFQVPYIKFNTYVAFP
jgi:hypothetical protein